jgi:uncharacterized protein YacL
VLYLRTISKQQYFLDNNILSSYFSNKNKIDLQLEVTRYIQAQLKRLNSNGADIFTNCPTLFDGKEAIIKLILGLLTISDTLTNAFSIVNKIIPVRVFFFSFFTYLFKLNLGNGYLAR